MEDKCERKFAKKNTFTFKLFLFNYFYFIIIIFCFGGILSDRILFGRILSEDSASTYQLFSFLQQAHGKQTIISCIFY